jgi:16S rRNA pseudouridine516 synthase
MRRAVAQGRVTVDGAVVVSADARVDPALPVRIDGQDADYRPHDYLMLHKPAGVVSATEDPRLPTVIGLLPPRYRRRGLFPVGRLDRDTTGLLLLTNDGALAHALMAPGRHVDKVYMVLVEGPLTEADRAAFAAGLTLRSGEAFAPAELSILSSGARSLARLTLREGRHHQIKRMMAARGHEVQSLKRVSIARLTLDETLPPGAWRPLSDGETALLRAPSAALYTK